MGLETRILQDEDALRRAGRRKGHTETKTFIVGGDITTSLYIPPFFVGVDFDGDTPEWKVLAGLRGQVRTDQAEFTVLLNEVAVTAGWWIGTDPATSAYTFPDPIDLALGDAIRIQCAAISGTPTDLAACVLMVTAAS